MKKAEAKIGMMATVIGDTPEPQVYDITEINGHSARLTYRMANGNLVSGGWVDVSMLVEHKAKPQVVHVCREHLAMD